VKDGWGRTGRAPVRVETLVTGLEVPWGIAFLPGGDWLVTERPGRVRLVSRGALQPEPVARLQVTLDQESGLLGIAVHPRFGSQNRWLYLYVTVDTPSGRVNRVERWSLAEDHRSAQRDRILLDGIPAGRYHDGGRIRFGPDGMLYVATGDAQDPSSAQDPNSRAGKILRVTADGDVPADNPFPGSPVYVLGVRNVQAIDWRPDRALVIAEHGPSGELGRQGHDRLAVVGPGANVGWPTVYGCQTGSGLARPSMSFVEALPPGGAAFYTANAIPEWTGSFLVGTLRSRHLHRFVLDASGDVVDHEMYFVGDPPAGFGRLRDVVVAPDGSVYVTTSNCDARGTCPLGKDRVLRITR
jgi:glucose/arabinose dehydrogenase